MRRSTLERFVVEQTVQVEPAVADAVADRLRDGFRLLVDLLQHERLEAGLLGALVVPVEDHEVALDGASVRRAKELGAVARDRDDVAVLREVHLARLAEERGRVRAEERLALADADDERALVAGADEQARVVAVDRDEGEVALELVEGEPGGLDEIAVVVLLDQVADGLGVGLGGEDVPLRLQAPAQVAVVLDDAVEHDRQLGRVLDGERMGVLGRDASVRGPAGVAEPGRGRRGSLTGGDLQVLKVPHRTGVAEALLLEQRDPRGVVATVFEALEAEEQELLALPGPHVSDDPTHSA